VIPKVIVDEFLASRETYIETSKDVEALGLGEEEMVIGSDKQRV
jgi:hypothetical protein